MQEEGEREGSPARATDGHRKLDGHRLFCRAAVDFILSGHVRLDDGKLHGQRLQKGRG